MTAELRSRDSGSKSGQIWAGEFKLVSNDGNSWITFRIDTNGDLLLTNAAGETATVNLS